MPEKHDSATKGGYPSPVRIEQEQTEKKSLFQSPFPLSPVQIGAARVFGHAFLPLQQIRPMIETLPLAKAAEAYGRMMRNEARFRIVLVTGQ